MTLHAPSNGTHCPRARSLPCVLSSHARARCTFCLGGRYEWHASQIRDKFMRGFWTSVTCILMTHLCPSLVLTFTSFSLSCSSSNRLRSHPRLPFDSLTSNQRTIFSEITISEAPESTVVQTLPFLSSFAAESPSISKPLISVSLGRIHLFCTCFLSECAVFVFFNTRTQSLSSCDATVSDAGASLSSWPCSSSFTSMTNRFSSERQALHSFPFTSRIGILDSVYLFLIVVRVFSSRSTDLLALVFPHREM